jgi:hypothetical protein
MGKAHGLPLPPLFVTPAQAGVTSEYARCVQKVFPASLKPI